MALADLLNARRQSLMAEQQRQMLDLQNTQSSGLAGLGQFFSTDLALGVSSTATVSCDSTNFLDFAQRQLITPNVPRPHRSNAEWLRNRVNEICRCWK
jgi:hypothetical protein